MDKLGWLIESTKFPGAFWDGRGFTDDTDRCVWYLNKASATRVVLASHLPSCEATEHMWIEPAALAGEEC